MKASELIWQLEHIIRTRGDLEVETTDYSFTRVKIREPIIAYRKILTGRQSKACFWGSENESARGDMVIRL